MVVQVKFGETSASAKACAMLFPLSCSVLRLAARRSFTPAPSFTSPILRSIPTIRQFHASSPTMVTMNQAMRRKKKKIRSTVLTRSPLLEKCPQKKGVCTSVYVTSPKKPNSGKRKVARIKLTTGETCQAYIQGEGHNLQEHSVVVVRGGRAQDLPGVLCVSPLFLCTTSRSFGFVGTRSSVGHWIHPVL